MRRSLGLLAVIVLLSGSPALAQSIITTSAGNGRIFRGDGGPATSANLGEVQGVAVDATGNVYASDGNNKLVVRISPAGVLTVVAGNGIAGFSGDGGPATSASLRNPVGVALDSSGNLYIADAGNGQVRRVTPAGIISTVASGGAASRGVAVDSAGAIFIADTYSHRVRRVDTRGIITTVAGTGTAGYSGDNGPADRAALNTPGAVALDSAGNLYIADSINNRVRKVTAGIIATVAGNGMPSYTGDGGPAVNAAIGAPRALALDGSGQLYIVQGYPGPIRRVNAAGVITTVAGGRDGFSGDRGPATAAAMREPGGVAVDGAGSIYIADSGNGRVRKVTSDGVINTIAGLGLVNYSGDGGPATSASVSEPKGVAVNAAGDLFIADHLNRRVRKVDSAGIITTVAGNGQQGFAGDGGPATAATLSDPNGVVLDGMGNLYIADRGRIRRVSGGVITTFVDGMADARGVAVDRSGNLYIADTFNHRIRKVNTAGVISTAAGTGVAGFDGDGRMATTALLNTPYSVAVDAAGVLYVADSNNIRVRRVALDGTISTVAGGGTSFPGDGLPALAAHLGFPTSVALDSVGNILIADLGARRVRRVGSTGIITTVAGNGETGFSGDGGDAARAVLNEPTSIALDSAGNLYIADTRNDRVRKVLAGPPPFSVTPSSLSFTVPSGAPASGAQRLTVSSPATGLPFSTSVSTTTGGNWLSVSPASGSSPGTISVSVDATSLVSGTYRGTITVQAFQAAPPAQTVAVDVVVQPATPAQLAVEPSGLTFEIPAGATNPSPQTLRIRNTGGGSLQWTARAETTRGGNWLSVSPGSGSASAGVTAAVQVGAAVSGLAPGVYSGSIIVSSAATGQTRTVAVNLLLSAATQTILVSQTGLLFTGVEGGGIVPSQSFGILNTGQGTMNWTMQGSSLSGGNWLTVTPASGRSDAASTQVPLVEAAVNVAGLRAGRYSALVRIESAGANNSPQFVSVDLNVLPAGANPGVVLRPTGLIFAAPAGASSPSSQTVRLATAAPGSAAFVGGLLTFSGGDWLDAAPRSAALSAAEPRTITVQPTLGALAPGIYRGALTLLFGDGGLQTLNVLLLVVPPASAPAAAGGGLGLSEAVGAGTALAVQDCVPERLHAVYRSLGSSFGSSVSYPTTIEVQVADNCGAAVPNASVVVNFSNGDPALLLVSHRNGTYVNSWRPATAATQVTVTARATLAPLAAAEVQAQGQVGAGSAPSLFSGGVVSGASFARGATLAPGAIVSVFGANLARGLNHASRLPLETTLGGATMVVGGRDVPLFFSSQGQINAQLPADLAPNSRPHVIVRTRRDGSGPETVAGPEAITVSAAQPAIFTTNQQGTGQGAILNAQAPPRLVDGAAPARAGEIVQVFCTGLGATQPSVPAGQAAPSAEPLARVITQVEARIGDRPAPVHFAGLAPGFAGLYQVNVEVPAGVTPGPAVALVLVQNGVPSNTVTLAIR